MNPSAHDQIIEILEWAATYFKDDRAQKIENILFAIKDGRILINEIIGDPQKQWDVENTQWLGYVEYGKQLGYDEWDARKWAAKMMEWFDKNID